jgi:hypothetical protein
MHRWCRQRYSECQLVDFEEVEMRDASAQHDAQHDDGKDGEPVYAALLIVCRDEGYDKDHEMLENLIISWTASSRRSS